MSQVQTQILIKFIFRISTKHQLFNQTSASPINLKFKILTKPSFRISTKIQLHDLYKTSAEKTGQSSSFKSCLNFNFKILTKPCAQSLNKQKNCQKAWRDGKIKKCTFANLMPLSQQISGVSFLSLCKRYCLDFHYWKGIEVLTQQISIKWVKYC